MTASLKALRRLSPFLNLTGYNFETAIYVETLNEYIVYEYIYRYSGFTGFFTRSNVTALTRATAEQ